MIGGDPGLGILKERLSIYNVTDIIPISKQALEELDNTEAHEDYDKSKSG